MRYEWDICGNHSEGMVGNYKYWFQGNGEGHYHSISQHYLLLRWTEVMSLDYKPDMFISIFMDMAGA
jgi:hypothetical protein